MFRWVHRNSRFNKQMESLQKAGKKAVIAVKKAEEIIGRLAGGKMPTEAGALTRYGEYRINNCKKYDLGSGYRMITIHCDDQLFILYIGTHDECHRWIENNKKYQPESDLEPDQWFSIEVEKAEDRMNETVGAETDEADDYLEPIDEKDLRVIFRGICGG